MIELLVVIGITLVIAAASAPLYGTFQISSQLNESVSQTVQTIRTAREKSYARTNDSSYGVYFQSDRYTLYQGPSYALRTSSFDREIVLDSALSISTTLAGNEVNFSKGLGEPDNTGTISIVHSASGGKTIAINQLGLVEEQ